MRFAFCFAYLLLVSVGAIAQTASLSDTIRLDEVVVTGTKVGVARSQVPFTVSTISRSTIEHSGESALLPLLSRTVPGIFITERGVTGFGVSNGSAGSISIRGIGGSPNTQVLVLINGNPQFAGLMGHPLPDAYRATDIERVEIIRGPASVLYGTNAMGGVINIITRQRAMDGFELNARATYGSFNTQKYALSGGYRKNKLSLFGSVNYDKTDGHRDTSSFNITNTYIKGAYSINSWATVNADAALALFDAQDPGGISALKAGYAIDIMRGNASLSFLNSFEKAKGSIHGFYNFGEHDITDGFHSTDYSAGLIAYQSLMLLPNNTLTIGAEAKRYGGFAENVISAMQIGDTSVVELAAYGLVQQVLAKALTLNAGFRVEHHNVYGWEPVPTAGFAWQVWDNTTLKGSYAKGFRSPTIRELYLFPPANEDLKPERSQNFEVGVMSSLWNGKLHTEVSMFRTDADNLIKMVQQGSVRKNMNTGKFTSKGLELSLKAFPVEKLMLMANYTYTNLSDEVIAMPEQLINLKASYTLNKFTLAAGSQWVQNLYTRVMPTPVSEDYLIFDASVTYRYSKWLELYVKADNLLDENYSINYDYPMPGFTAFVGLNVKLEGK